jgi:hypothetical protein
MAREGFGDGRIERISKEWKVFKEGATAGYYPLPSQSPGFEYTRDRSSPRAEVKL